MRCLGKPFLGPTKILVSICLALLLGGCAEFTVINVDGTEKVPDKVPQDPAEVVDPPQSKCRGLNITKPLQNDVIATPSFQVSGVIDGDFSGDVMIDGQPTQVQSGAFELTLNRPDGSHEIEVKCDSSSASITVLVSTARPSIELDSPQSGQIVQGNGASVQVQGTIRDGEKLSQLTMNGRPLPVGPDGRFEAQFISAPGINHLDLVGTLTDGSEIDLRRSFIAGQFTPWNDQSTTMIVGNVGRRALEAVAASLERVLTPRYIEDIMDEQMGRRGSIQLHEIRFNQIKIDMTPTNGKIRIQLRLERFGLKFTYHYSILGIGGRIRGWANCRPLDVGVDLNLRAKQDGGYDLNLSNASVQLRGFDLDLNDFYSVVEGLIQPMVRDLGTNSIRDALNDVLIQDLVQADLLDQPVDILGQTANLRMRMQELNVDQNGIRARVGADMSPFGQVYSAPGFWTGGSQANPQLPDNAIALGFSVDFFNRLLGEAWRGGLLDLDLAELMGDTSLSVALLAGAAGGDLLEHFAGTAGIELTSQAKMQPTIRVSDPVRGGLELNIGALEVSLASEDINGDNRVWARLELSAVVSILPEFINGEFALKGAIDTRVELVEAPVTPINETEFEGIVETLINGMSESVLNEFIDSSVAFELPDLMGLGVGNVTYGGIPNANSFLMMGLELRPNP